MIFILSHTLFYCSVSDYISCNQQEETMLHRFRGYLQVIYFPFISLFEKSLEWCDFTYMISICVMKHSSSDDKIEVIKKIVHLFFCYYCAYFFCYFETAVKFWNSHGSVNTDK